MREKRFNPDVSIENTKKYHLTYELLINIVLFGFDTFPLA